MTPRPSTRRAFLGTVSAGVGGVWMSANWPAIASAGSHAAKAITDPGAVEFQTFSPDQVAEIEAIAARILPSDDGPGAHEAGVVYFLDKALATFLRDQRPLLAGGLAQLDAAVAARLPGRGRFSSLEAAEQDDVLRSIETGAFFQMVRRGTIAGFLANPSYGGNRGSVGWHAIGFEDRFVWQPPFGYYDREDIVGP